MELKKGMKFRILKASSEDTWVLGNGDTDFYGLREGAEFTLDEIDANGDGWCKVENLPDGIIPFWIENSPGKICMLISDEADDGCVELVE